MNNKELNIDEQYEFDLWLDFLNEHTDYTESLSFVQVHPSIEIIEDTPVIAITVCGTDCEDFRHFSFTRPEGTDGPTKGFFDKENSTITHYTVPKSDKGTLLFKDKYNEYSITWEKLNDDVIKFTNTHFNKSILFVKDVGIVPEDVSKVKEEYMEAILNMTDSPIFKMSVEAGLIDEDLVRQSFLKKLEDLEKLGNQSSTLNYNIGHTLDFFRIVKTMPYTYFDKTSSLRVPLTPIQFSPKTKTNSSFLKHLMDELKFSKVNDYYSLNHITLSYNSTDKIITLSNIITNKKISIYFFGIDFKQGIVYTSLTPAPTQNFSVDHIPLDVFTSQLLAHIRTLWADADPIKN